MVLPFVASTPELISSVCAGFSGCFVGDIGFSSSDFADTFCVEADCTGAGFMNFGGTGNADCPVSSLKDIGCASSGSLGVGDSSVVSLVASVLVGSDCEDTAEFSGVFFLEEFVEEDGAPERLLDFASIPVVEAVPIAGDCVIVSCVAVGVDCTSSVFPSSCVLGGRVLVEVGVVDSLPVGEELLVVLVDLDVEGGYEDDAFE
ncbi:MULTISPECIES: hypothetical protein [unclassified Bartonella]|uniref:hypothetical protein n=1 Tax=unclassified Bartonella TaxID=2645622 RepID=UPI0035CFCCAE